MRCLIYHFYSRLVTVWRKKKTRWGLVPTSLAIAIAHSASVYAAPSASLPPSVAQAMSSIHPRDTQKVLQHLHQTGYPATDVARFLTQQPVYFVQQQALSEWFWYHVRQRAWEILDQHPAWIARLQQAPPYPRKRLAMACAIWIQHAIQKKPVNHTLPFHTLLQQIWDTGAHDPYCAKAVRMGLKHIPSGWETLRTHIGQQLLQGQTHGITLLHDHFPYIARQLFPESKYLFSHPLRTYRDPYLSGWALLQTLKKNPDDARVAYNQWQNRHPLPASMRFFLEKQIGLYLATDYHVDAWAWLNRSRLRHGDRLLHEWRVRQLLANQEWKTLITLLTPATHDFDRYWLARAYQATGQTRKAQALFRELARHAGYYGFWSQRHLSTRLPMTWPQLPRSASISRQAIQALAQQPAWKRIRLHWNNQQRTEAETEWRFALSRHPEQRWAAAQLALDWKWYPMSLRSLGMPPDNRMHPLVLQNPLAYAPLVRRAASQHQIHPAWIFAIIRQESYFAPHARSPRGALGLMQIQVPTARDMGWRGSTPKAVQQLTQPATNIALGTRFFKSLLTRYGDHPIQAVAAYNAGPRHVQQWLFDRPDLDPDLWIETIPFKETRLYVKNVLSHAIAYDWVIGKRTPIPVFLARWDAR